MAGFHDHARPPPGHHNAHHILLCQQHDKSWHIGHVFARCVRRVPRGTKTENVFFFFLFLVTPAPLDWRGFNSANIVMLSITGTCTTCPTEEEQKKAHTSY